MDQLITSRLSLDQLQQFFDSIWQKSDRNDYPTASEFKFRMRKYLLGNSCLSLEVTEEDLDVEVERKELTGLEGIQPECYSKNPENCISSIYSISRDKLTDVSIQSELLETEDWEQSGNAVN